MNKMSRIIKLLSISKRPLTAIEIQMITKSWFIRVTLADLESRHLIKHIKAEGYILI